MKCLVFAYSEIGVVGLESLLNAGHEIVGVITHEDNPWEHKWFRSVEELARERHIPVIKPEDPNTPETVTWCQSKHADVVFSFYYRQMLKEPLLQLAPLGAFNLHGSLLPKFRGRAPVNWAIIEGATETGLTLHEMWAKPDAGKILGQRAVPIGENDTAKDVFEKLVPCARSLLDEVVLRIANGTAERRPQDPTQATYFSGRKPDDGRLDWHWTSERIHNMIRALTSPYPGAFAFYEGKKILIWKGRLIPGASKRNEAPGTLIAHGQGTADIVTGNGTYRLHEVQIEGLPLQPAATALPLNSILR